VLAKRVRRRFGMVLHPRTIEKALVKKGRQKPWKIHRPNKKKHIVGRAVTNSCDRGLYPRATWPPQTFEAWVWWSEKG